ncbi:hypothetical protein EHS13_15220 [Paenibacillus psychroresistens]|uniref:Butirosin biosynthesis protein H N-terminal domain-containing protein n=1 Tax=Paenibacillus psychroresistens TaxID=1778678 RepID=A0A6B8RJA8_9BACL|nr:hypothetical protein [Paenibacillus psychroresistens]QGQ96129.1 hypothetical protein EHS13_15220 [Paenibacillus psychroresistens]
MEKRLPVTYPLVNTWPYHSCLMSIISQYDYCAPWIFMNYIQLKTHAEVGSIFVDFYLFDYDVFGNNPWLKDKTFKLDVNTTKELARDSGISKFLINFIKKGYYIFFSGLSDYYIPDTIAFQKDKDSLHGFLVYGYNSNEGVFEMGGHFVNGKFAFKTIKFSDFENGFDSANGTGFVQLIPVVPSMPFQRENNILILRDVVDLLEDYLYSRNTSERMALMYTPLANMIWGIDIYNELIKYIQYAGENKSLTVDYRQFHLLNNHKKILIRLCDYVDTNFKIENGKAILSLFIEIERDTSVLLGLILKMGFTRNLVLTNKIIVLLEEVRDKELILIKNFISAITDGTN